MPITVELCSSLLMNTKDNIKGENINSMILFLNPSKEEILRGSFVKVHLFHPLHASVPPAPVLNIRLTEQKKKEQKDHETQCIRLCREYFKLDHLHNVL